MTELGRRDFLTLSLGVALLPIIPSLAYGSNSFGKIVILCHDSAGRMTEEFPLTESQMFGSELVEPLMMTADRPCTVTGCRAEFPFLDQIKSLDLLPSYAGRTWALRAGDTLTLLPLSPWVELV